jgi:hypothetical protein
MRIAIIALVISLAALGLAGFATARTFSESHPAPAVESQWSEAECADARDGLDTLRIGCMTGKDCTAYSDMIMVIAYECP